jgi:alanyl-tRNA synthetase
MKGNDIREAYLSFFESKGHLRLDSFSLIPKNDPSLLLIGAGMAPLKPYFTGKVEPPRHRVTTSQKCIRTGDIENVGHTARHHTFFEMLGNFSFGDYFKKEAITWAWEFLTEVVKLDPSRLYVTIYPKDEEAHDYWHKMIGIPENHIYRLDDNFWEIGEGPCGPDSEIFYDQGESFGTDPANQMGGDGDRFLEIWNLVFSQYDRQKDGSYLPLAKKNIDTGAGLERLAAVLQGKRNNFESDLFFPIIERASALSHVKYGQGADSDVALKVIADHSRAITNLIADGVLPSNEGRGYVLRRILRRAIRFGKLLGIEQPFLGSMIDEVVDMMKPAYPELVEKQVFIKKIAGVEENRFQSTLNAGTDLLSELMEDAKKKHSEVLAGKDVFKLYDTYGFPWELTQEIAEEQGLSIDKKGFDAAMNEQKERARNARAKVSMKVATPDTTRLKTEELTVNDVDGDTEILMLGQNGKEIEEAADGQEITVILKNNPFHAEGGGQVGDTGRLVGAEGVVLVEDCHTLPDGMTYLTGTVSEGVVARGDKVRAEVDRERRHALARNHTGTHLLQAALRQVLGKTVTQAGSLVLPDRLRFDFTWPEPMTAKQLAEVERLVNDQILLGTPVTITSMPQEEARKLGAMALFGEKYGDIVRVVRVGDFSMELCGGSHVANTGEIGSFRIISEGGIGSGVRRIEALTGHAAYESMAADRALLEETAGLLKGKKEEIPNRIARLMEELKNAEHEIAALKKEQAKGALGDILSKAEVKNGISYLGAIVKADNMDELRKVADLVKAQLKDGAFVLGCVSGEKVNLVGMASDTAVAHGVHMGKVVSRAAKICGGGGGGKPKTAQAGGRDVSKLPDAVAEGARAIADMIN